MFDIINLCLGDQTDKQVDFFISKSFYLSSLSSDHVLTNEELINSIKIKMTTLDVYCKNKFSLSTKIGLIKIDVEGEEIRV